MDESNVSLRYGPPTKITREPYGYQVRVISDEAPTICYLQVSKDYDHPKWVRYSTILERIFFDKLDDAAFMADCLDKYIHEHIS